MPWAPDHRNGPRLPTWGSADEGEDRLRGCGYGCGSSAPVPRGAVRKHWGGIPRIRAPTRLQREEFAVRPRTMPTNASTAGVVRSATQASATGDGGALT